VAFPSRGRKRLLAFYNFPGDSSHTKRSVFSRLDFNEMIVERSQEAKCPSIYVAKEIGMPLQPDEKTYNSWKSAIQILRNLISS